MGQNNMHSALWTASILSFHVAQEDDRRVAKYTIRIDCKQDSWVIQKRYHQFKQLYTHICKTCCSHDDRQHALKLPPRKIFGNRLDTVFLKRRSLALDHFVKCLAIDTIYRELECVLHFFSLESYCATPFPLKRPSHIRQNFKGFVHHILTRACSLFKPGPPTPPPSKDFEACQHAPSIITCSSTSSSSNVFNRRLTIHDFDIIKLIGKGSFGNVFLARFKHDNQLYAIKVISKALVREETDFRHIMSERNILTQDLDHPFLIKLKCTFQSESKLYIVMQYINGGEMFYHLQHEHRFNETRAKLYAAEIVCAFEYLHSKAIIYRDLKPENVLLDSQGHVVLIDFGLAKDMMYQACPTFTFCGTPEYLAPEIILNQQYDTSVDWWCLGAVIYEMLVGLPPFYSKNRNEIFEKILHAEVEFPVGSASPAARDIVCNMLKRNPLSRLGSGPNGIKQIKSHPFFEGVDWLKVYNKGYQPPFVPVIKTEFGLDNFDPEFLRTSISSLYNEPSEGLDDSGSFLFDEHPLYSLTASPSSCPYTSDNSSESTSCYPRHEARTAMDSKLGRLLQFTGFSYHNTIELPAVKVACV